MMTKAYIQEVLTPYSVRLRVPLYHKLNGVNNSVPDGLLPVAAINTVPNIKIDPKVGDVVIVEFEEDDLLKPIVVGFLYNANALKSTTDIVCEDLSVNGICALPKDNTTIGEIEYKNIECLKNQEVNIKEALELITDSIDGLSGELSNASKLIGDNTELISTNTSNISTNTANISTNTAAITSLTATLQGIPADTAVQLSTLFGKISTIEDSISNLDKKFDDYIKKYPAIVDSKTYGSDTNKPSKPSEGQIYFTIK